MKERSTMALVGNRPTPTGLHKNHEMTYSRLVSAIKQYAVASQVQQATATKVPSSPSGDMLEKEPKKMSTSSLLAKSKYFYVLVTCSKITSIRCSIRYIIIANKSKQHISLFWILWVLTIIPEVCQRKVCHCLFSL